MNRKEPQPLSGVNNSRNISISHVQDGRNPSKTQTTVNISRPAPPPAPPAPPTLKK